MPEASFQQPLQTLFRCLVLQRIQMAIQTNQVLTVLQAEQEVRQQLEQELLQFLLENNTETHDHPIENTRTRKQETPADKW